MIEILEQVSAELVKSQKSYYLTGVLVEANKRNKNGRIYSKSTLDNALRGLNGRKLVVKLDHRANADGLEGIGAVFESISWDGDRLVGRAKVLENTPAGKQIIELARSGVDFGFSISSLGQTEYDPIHDVTRVVDLELKSCDIVSNPSSNRLAELVYESTLRGEDRGPMTLEELVTRNLNQTYNEAIKQRLKEDAQISEDFISELGQVIREWKFNV